MNLGAKSYKDLARPKPETWALSQPGLREGQVTHRIEAGAEEPCCDESDARSQTDLLSTWIRWTPKNRKILKTRTKTVFPKTRSRSRRSHSKTSTMSCWTCLAPEPAALRLPGELTQTQAPPSYDGIFFEARGQGTRLQVHHQLEHLRPHLREQTLGRCCNRLANLYLQERHRWECPHPWA